MNEVSVRLPESLHKKLVELAEKDNVTSDQFISTAVAEKIAAILTESYLEERAKRGNREKFLGALKKVADVEPEDYDKL